MTQHRDEQDQSIRDHGYRDDDILPRPPAEAVPVLHNREYRIESYRLGTDRLLIQGALRDQKPPGLFIPDDPEPLTIHHMTLELEVRTPSMEIVDVRTHFPSHPQPTCVDIIDHYDKLVGLSIARGFTHKVRELFGGPRGCSHTTALLQAMAPIAMQSISGFEILDANERGEPNPVLQRPDDESWNRLVNTCHVWADGSQRVELLRQGDPSARTAPMTMTQRVEELRAMRPAKSAPH